jgi:hypothetical protein
MLNSPDLSTIRQRCNNVIDEATAALREPLTTVDGETADSPEARTVLAGTVKAAKALLAHLEENYDFGRLGGAELKEGACLD